MLYKIYVVQILSIKVNIYLRKDDNSVNHIFLRIYIHYLFAAMALAQEKSIPEALTILEGLEKSNIMTKNEVQYDIHFEDIKAFYKYLYKRCIPALIFNIMHNLA